MNFLSRTRNILANHSLDIPLDTACGGAYEKKRVNIKRKSLHWNKLNFVLQ